MKLRNRRPRDVMTHSNSSSLDSESPLLIPENNMGQLIRQVGILLKKELLIISRSKLWFFFEILAGLLLLPLIVFIVAKSGGGIHKSQSFGPVNLHGNSQDIQQQVKSIARIFQRWCGSPKLVGYSGYDSTIASTLMLKIEERFKENPTRLTIRQFENIDALRKTLIKDLNDTSDKMCGRFLGGVHFEKLDLSSKELKYRILFPRRMEQKWYLQDFWPEDGPYSASADFNYIPGEPQYWSSGFLSLQFAIESSFLELLGTNIEGPVYLQRMPTAEFKNSQIIAFLKRTPGLWMILVLMSLLHTVKNIVAEKDAGIKTFMMAMGLNSVAFYGSHFLIGAMKVGITMIICAGTFSIGLVYVSASLFIVFSLLFAIASIMFGILISALIRKPTLALIAALVGWIGFFVIDMMYTVSLIKIPQCFLASLNVFTALKLGISAMRMSETTTSYIGWTNMFANSSHTFTVGLALLMLVFDILIMLLLALYLDAVCPTDSSPRRHPWFLFGYKYHNELLTDGHDEVDADEVNENVETDSAMGKDLADIDVRHMSKIWEGTGQRAVDDLSFRAYRGQITVLLGHNGAGKSTTFSVISGSTKLSSGSVYICKADLRENLHDCQRNVGFCPQYNPLFPRLTVKEHLQFYAKLKSDEKSHAVDAEIDEITGQIQLKSKLDTLAEALSGGMKRKLCVAMALIGDSRVVLLDEPTAGMDPEARNDVRILLEKSKKHRTILLTTHYMDEADLLGDRIGIMVKGRMVCNGSSEFLKHRFGTGYILTFTVDQTYKVEPIQTTAERILRVAKKHTPDAKLDNMTPHEFSVILPVDQKKYFANLFEELESRKKELQIGDFGLSFNTLEQIFLRVGEIADPQEQHQEDNEGIEKDAAELFSTESTQCGDQVLCLKQIATLFHRHFLNLQRNKWRTIGPILVSLILFGLYAGFHSYDNTIKNESKDLSLASLDPLSIPVITSQSSTTSLNIPFLVGKLPQMRLLSLSPLGNMTAELIRRAYEDPPLGIGANVMANNTIMALFNGAFLHGPPTAINLVTNSMLKKGPQAIQLSIEIYDVPTHDFESAEIAKQGTDVNLVVAIIAILAFSSLTSTFVMEIVEDNVSRFKNQLLLTKMNIWTYWISLILWHLLIYLVFCLLLTIVFVAFGWMQGVMIENFVLWALYFWSILPFVYCFSFLFNSSVKAYAALLCWNVVISVIALITDVTFQALQLRIREVFHYLTYIVLPAFSLGNGIIQVAIHAGIPNLPEGTVFEAIKSIIYCQLAGGLLFWSIICVLESKRIALLAHSLHCKIRRSPYQIVDGEVELNEDEDVTRERENVRSKEDNAFALTVREIYKFYGDFCAVRGLTFGVKQNDCFGLLGVNGAGKTTTFSILTGEMFASAGRATVEGVDVVDGPTIGYCPQFDALALDLTGRELLTILGRLNGFHNVEHRVQKVLESIRMAPQADKLIGFYSGGQKRRLSIGVTLMSKSTFIMLDEPTAGIDPSTRRKIWQLIQAVRKQNVAILLTSHSMEECEALCNRIGFMNKGALISIGSSQHLKSRYGNSFLLTFTIANPEPAVSAALDAQITREFNANSTLDPPETPTQHWEIPRLPGQTWSKLFRRAQEIADSHPHQAILPPGSSQPRIIDFSLTQNSLEQVFLRLAEMSQTEPVLNRGH
uniref:ABC transporter domain-containing protein n=1 Tax=Bursaphelenchus xylophilus TaxID=6326 RepID=A0A1I7SQX2_BURXY